MDKKLVGPPLQDVVETQGRDWVSKWVYNSQALIESGDAHAKEIYNEYNQMAMPSYSFLAEDELSALVDYLEGYKTNKAQEAPAVEVATSEDGASVETSEASSKLPKYIWIIVGIILVVLTLSAVAIIASIKILDNFFNKMALSNSHLMKKLNVSQKEVEDEVDSFVEKEVAKRVKTKLKSVRDQIDQTLK